MKGHGRPRGWNGSGSSPVKKKIMMENVSDSPLSEAKSNSARSMPMEIPAPGTAPCDRELCTDATGVSDEAPIWFRRFEQRQEVRFQEVLKECSETHAGLQFDIDNLKDEVSKITQVLKMAEIKIDELENRGRRNNIVLFNIPEGMEGNNCAAFINSLITEASTDPAILGAAKEIQRAHRSGKKNPVHSGGERARPRPIHVGYSSFQAKEKSKKCLRELFKSKKFGPNDASFFVSDDYSRKVQQLRKEKVPELKRLRKEGKRAYLVYPAEIRIQDPGTESIMDQSQLH